MPRKTFASNCSACHKSPQGLAKSGQVAGFLRQHYTTGPEMSAAMAAYLVAAGSAPAGEEGRRNAPTRAAQDQGQEAGAARRGTAAAETADAMQSRTAARQAAADKSHERGAPPTRAGGRAAAGRPAGATLRQAACETPPAHRRAAGSRRAAAPAQPRRWCSISRCRRCRTAPPPELAQSVFSSSPLP